MSQIWKKSRANKHTQNESTAPKTKKSFFHLNDYRTNSPAVIDQKYSELFTFMIKA